MAPREALQGPFYRTDDLVEAVHQATALSVGDIIGCGREDTNTEGTESFGEYMAMLAAAMPVSPKDLVYDRRIPDLCRNRTGQCLRVLLKRVQNKELANDADTWQQPPGAGWNAMKGMQIMIIPKKERIAISVSILPSAFSL